MNDINIKILSTTLSLHCEIFITREKIFYHKFPSTTHFTLIIHTYVKEEIKITKSHRVVHKLVLHTQIMFSDKCNFSYLQTAQSLSFKPYIHLNCFYIGTQSDFYALNFDLVYFNNFSKCLLHKRFFTLILFVHMSKRGFDLG